MPLSFRNELLPAEPVRGRKPAPKLVKQRANIKTMVTNYAVAQPVDGGRLSFLKKIQHHMAKDFPGMILEDENE